jgi:hypothetical protein
MTDQVTEQTGKTLGEPVNEEIGRDESWFDRVGTDKDLAFMNQKRTYDAYQHAELEQLRLQNQYLQKVLSDAQKNSNALDSIVAQAIQNAVTVANMVAQSSASTFDMTGKQALRQGDVAAKVQWNPVTEASGNAIETKAVQLDDASVKAIAAALATAFTQTVAKTA